ncbi:hypothetical protein ACIA48_26800 [Mycobacterium sp. NPDC051804]|uniref:hypothetical protein n=1 Tax=Mycobacterium sp. NPDC051804 TaxID=3364295 RepID=UPI0037915C0A
MGDYLRLTAPEGGAAPDLQPVGRWPWIVLLLGVAIVVLGGFLLSHDTDVDTAGTVQPSVAQQTVP